MGGEVLLFLGLDIGGTKIAGGLVTETGKVVRRSERATNAHRGGPHVLATALELARTLADGNQIAAVGVGTGGQVDATRGVIVSATGLLPGWAGTNIKTVMQDALGVLCFVDNDVNALAMGEEKFGAARGKSTVVFLALGTGVGGALLLNGRLHHGAHWTGGEFGHLILDANTGRNLENYASGPGLLRTYREMGGVAETSREVAQNPDALATQAVTRTGEYLGWGLVSLANALDPDLMVIGGGLASLGDALLAPARRILSANALPGPAQCPVVVAALGADASVIGAASLAMDTKENHAHSRPRSS